MSLCCRGVSNLELIVTGKVEYDLGSGKYVSFVLWKGWYKLKRMIVVHKLSLDNVQCCSVRDE